MTFKVEIIFSLIHSQRSWQVFYINAAMCGDRRENMYECFITNLLTIGKATQCKALLGWPWLVAYLTITLSFFFPWKKNYGFLYNVICTSE